MISLQIELLGGFKTRLASGAPLVFSQRKAEAILAYLALVPDHAAPRTRLFNLLWSERGEEQARSSLRQALAALRKGLREAEPMPILSERGTVALIGEQVTVDAGKFEKLAQSDDFSDLQAAAALYQGDLLDDFAIAELPFKNGWIKSVAACANWLWACCRRWQRAMPNRMSSRRRSKWRAVLPPSTRCVKPPTAP